VDQPIPVLCAKVDLCRAIPAPKPAPLPIRAARAIKTKGIVYAARRAGEFAHLLEEKVEEAPAKPKRVWPARDDEALGLRPGEIVEVKSAEEIRATLDDDDKYKGLLFMGEMWEFCGQQFPVLKPMTNIVSEVTGWVHSGIKNTVLLDGSNCTGANHADCSASCYHMWREVWLRRVDSDA